MAKPEADQFQAAANATPRRRAIAALARYRPRVLTLLFAALVAALLLLANLTGEHGTRRAPAGSLASDKVGSIAVGNASNTDLNLTIDFDLHAPSAADRSAGNSLQCMSYGWPLLWRQYLIVGGYGFFVVGETYSGARLAINAAIWLVLLGAPAACCEWLLRRYRPRLRFSLRTLLAATALGAALCGWFAAARNRANVQDPLIAAMGRQRGRVWVERWGPKWLDLVGADRFRRRIVGVELHAVDDRGYAENELAKQGERLLADLKRLRDLRFLYFEAESLTPEIAASLSELRRLQTLWLEVDEAPATSVQTLAAALGGMRHLRVLNLDFGIYGPALVDDTASHELLAAIGAMPQLEYLNLTDCLIARKDFALLAKLTNLKSLTLNQISCASDEGGSLIRWRDGPLDPPLLSRLPVLPQLETLDLTRSDVYDEDLPYITAQPRLKSLDLNDTEVTGAGLAELARSELLEALTIDEKAESRAAFESLLAIKQLRVLYADISFQGSLCSLDSPRERWSRLSNDEIDGRLRALAALRRAKSELVIDDIWARAELRPWEQMAPKCKTIPDNSVVWAAEHAVRHWHEQQAANSPAAGASNPAAPQDNSER